MDKLVLILRATLSLDNNERKKAERDLLQLEQNNGFSSFIFNIIIGNDALEIKVAAAISFKNFIKRNWQSDEMNDDKISQNDRVLIKSNIIELMLNNPSMIQNQLSEAVGVIGKYDFPHNWEGLLPQLIGKINQGNFNIINGVLRTCNSLFKRYRFETRSDKLFIEIKEVIAKMGIPLCELLQQTMSHIQQHSADQNALNILWNSVVLIEKVFLSLNSQDLPEYFEDSMNLWMAYFHQILQDNNALLNTDMPDEVGILEQAKSTVCDIISLYAMKYDEEFTDYIGVFIDDILKVLITSSKEPKYDSLVSKGLHFLTMVADRKKHRDLFVSKINLAQLSQDIIIPNIEFQDCDQELFIDNPEEYIRRDIEGSHCDTRRKSACELVKSLCGLFEEQVVSNFVVYIQQLLQLYGQDNELNWKMKDSALFLITSVASKGETGRYGVTLTTEFVNINDFYRSHVIPELQDASGGNPVIKADCIKYLVTFRSKIPADELRKSINLLIPFANNPFHVVHSYAAAAINKLLMVRDPTTNVAVINANHIANPTSFITSLCAAMGIAGSEDNVYLMQATMRTLSTLQDKSLECMNHLVDFLVKKLSLVIKYSRKPAFNHSLIETIAICIKIVCGANPTYVSHFDWLLLPALNPVFADDMEDFLPYALQLASLMLDHHPAQHVPESYQNLFPFVINLDLWMQPGLIPSLIRLLLSYLEKADWSIIANQLQNIIAIFQRLNRSRNFDTFTFSLVTAIMLHVPRQHTEPFLRTIFESIFQRLTSNKTPTYLRGFVQFFSGLMIIFTPTEIIQLINNMQANLFQLIIDSALLQSAIKMETEKKIFVVGVTKLITESPEMKGPYSSHWAKLLGKIIETILSCAATDVDNEAHFVDIDVASSSTKLNQLVFVGKKIVDPAKEVEDCRFYLGNSLKQFASVDNQRFKLLYGALDSGTVAGLNQILSDIRMPL